jgi:hypothetical protein
MICKGLVALVVEEIKGSLCAFVLVQWLQKENFDLNMLSLFALLKLFIMEDEQCTNFECQTSAVAVSCKT